MEWGPGNKYLMSKFKGWVYRMKEILPDGSEREYAATDTWGFLASEDELLEWNK